MAANTECVFNMQNISNREEYLKEHRIHKRSIVFFRDLEQKVRWRDVTDNEKSFHWKITWFPKQEESNKYIMDIYLKILASLFHGNNLRSRPPYARTIRGTKNIHWLTSLGHVAYLLLLVFHINAQPLSPYFQGHLNLISYLSMLMLLNHISYLLVS